MSEAFISYPAAALRQAPEPGPMEGHVARLLTRGDDARGRPKPVPPAALPTIGPGQLWFVEFPATEAKFAPLEHLALTTANVVIYDRALASTVARYLPLGGYAEPAPEDGWSDAVLGRCLRFVRDGWSVTRLVDFPIAPVLQRTETLRHLSERLPGSAVLLFTNTGAGAYENSGSTLAELGATVDAAGRRGPLTLIFEAMVAEAAPRFSVALANGLAG